MLTTLRRWWDDDRPLVVFSILVVVGIGVLMVVEANDEAARNAPCVAYRIQHVNETRVGRRCGAFMCEEYETIPAHDAQVCTERKR
jgi:hypothetical protein